MTSGQLGRVALTFFEWSGSGAQRTRLGVEPTAVVAGKYAMWRTNELNFSINQMPARAGQLRHLGFEDSAAGDFSSTHDVNGIEWELFSPKAQDDKIVEVYGVPVRA